MLKNKKQKLVESILEAIEKTSYKSDHLNVFVDFAKDFNHGDLCTNIAFQLGSKWKANPYKIAEEIAKKIKKPEYIKKISVEKNGFINFSFENEVFSEFYDLILEKKEYIGSQKNKNIWYFIEIVSANPTGALHIGHARNAIFSDTLGNLLEYSGYLVHREYLINDVGNQIKEVVESVWEKYIHALYQTNFEKTKNISYDTAETENCAKLMASKFKEKWAWNENIFESKNYEEFKNFVIDFFLSDIKDDLKKYKIAVDYWRSEKSFMNDNAINSILKSIKKYLLLKENAVWFKLGELIDGQKDEVLIKSDGTHTYLMQDLIYHNQKLSLLDKDGKIINILGADHYGHIDKLKGFFKSQDIEKEKINFITIQLVKLLDNKKSIKISKRDSQVINLKDLSDFLSYEEVRWFFVSQAPDSHLEIELQKLKLHDYNNPVFYVMYAYARICKLLEKYEKIEKIEKKIYFETIEDGKEKEILNMLIKYPSIIEDASKTFLPHKITKYLFELAQSFHSFYGEKNLLKTKEKEIWLIERLALLNATKYIIKSGLAILKIEAKNEL